MSAKSGLMASDFALNLLVERAHLRIAPCLSRGKVLSLGAGRRNIATLPRRGGQACAVIDAECRKTLLR